MSDKYAALRAALNKAIAELNYPHNSSSEFETAARELLRETRGLTDLIELLSEREADKARIAELTSALNVANERYENRAPTEWAYNQACAAIEKHRARADNAERRIAELESRKVKLPGGYAVRSGHPINEGERGVLIPKDGGQWLPRFDVEHALHVAGITLETGE